MFFVHCDDPGGRWCRWWEGDGGGAGGREEASRCGKQNFHDNLDVFFCFTCNDALAIVAQGVVGNPRRLEQRWNHIRLKQIFFCQLSFMAPRCL